MFEKVDAGGYVGPFLATKTMEIGDIVLLHVGRQLKSRESAIYAYDVIVKGPCVFDGFSGRLL